MKDDTQVKKEKEEKKGEKASEISQEEVVLKKDWEALKETANQFENNYKRALADYQNLQKRVTNEKAEWVKLANRELLLRILPVLDTIFLAFKHSQDVSLQVSLQQFFDILKSEGVVRIETVGKEFNPELMEAIETVAGEEGKVVEEVRAGFLLHDTLLRPAQVKVGAKKVLSTTI